MQEMEFAHSIRMSKVNIKMCQVLSSSFCFFWLYLYSGTIVHTNVSTVKAKCVWGLLAIDDKCVLSYRGEKETNVIFQF